MRYYLTGGDPAGVGPEICLRFLADFPFADRFSDQDSLVFVGNEAILRRCLHVMAAPLAQKLEKVVDSLVSQQIKGVSLLKVPCCSHSLEKVMQPGEYAGEYAYLLLKKACEEIKKYLGDSNEVVLVTAPIDKSSIAASVDKNFQGHTEYLSDYFSCRDGGTMCFLTPLFHVILATTHVPLMQVGAALTKEILSHAIKNAFLLQKMVGDTEPLIVFGLNPHAGEKGLLGDEEKMIEHVIDIFRQQGQKIEGPLSADGTIRAVAQQSRVGMKRTVVACYHDQGLVAAKLASLEYESVHLTLGLPFLRFSVDHGTAYDARGRANALSLKNVFDAAVQISRAGRWKMAKS